MTQPSVRYQLSADRPSAIWFVGVTTAFLVFTIITEGFDWGLFVVVPGVMLIVFVVMEAGFRLNNYAIFHEHYADLRQVDLGDMRGAPELTVPYSAIRSIQAGPGGFLELALDLDGLPREQASRLEKRLRKYVRRGDAGPILQLRANDPGRLSAEFNRRLAAAPSSDR